jgi:hypothetical protein
MRARIPILLLFALIGTIASFGRALDRPTARLVYVRKGGATICPDEPLMRQLVAARLGYDPFRDDAERTVAVTITRESGAFRAKLEMQQEGKPTGTRTLSSTSNDCNELASSIALAVAIAVDPLGGAPPSSASPSVSASTSASAVPVVAPTIAPSTSASAPPPEMELHPYASLGGALAFGVAPNLTGSLTAAFGLRAETWSISLEGRVDAESTKRVPTGGEVSSSIIAGSVVPCLHHELILGCAIASYGSLRGAGSGVGVPREDRSAWVAIGVRIGLEAQIVGPISLRVHADGLAPLTRTTLRLEDRDVWTTPAVALLTGLAVSLHFR